MTEHNYMQHNNNKMQNDIKHNIIQLDNKKM